MQISPNLKNLKSFCGKRDAFDCAGMRAQKSKDPGSNPGTVESVFFPQKDFKFFKSVQNCETMSYAIYRWFLSINKTINKQINHCDIRKSNELITK